MLNNMDTCIGFILVPTSIMLNEKRYLIRCINTETIQGVL